MSFPILLLLIAGAFIFILMFLYFVPVNLWITAVFSNVRISIMDLVLMRLRKVPPSIVV
ncbi:MAG: flotillin-like FloA family protein, partial [Bacteroidota bacterium]